MDGTRKTVLCFGDSNTHGTVPMRSLGDRGRFPPEIRWTGILADELGPDWRVIDEGLPGRTTVHPDPVEGAHLAGLPAVPIMVGTHSPLDVVVIMLGTNDLKRRFGVGPADIAASVASLIRTFQAVSNLPGRPLPRFLVVAPPPILEVGPLTAFFEGGAEKSRGLAAYMRKVAEEFGAVFVDAGEHIVSSPVDGIHFDAEEHPKLGRAIAAAVRAAGA